MRTELLVAEGHTQATRRGQAELHGLRLGDVERPRAVKVYGASPIDGVSHTVRFEWEALDAWFEEDEQIFVHPAQPVRPRRRGPLYARGANRARQRRPGLVDGRRLERPVTHFFKSTA